MNNKVSTASFSIAAFWLGVLIAVTRFCDGGVAGTKDLTEASDDVLRLLILLVCKEGGCNCWRLERRELRGNMSAGGSRDGPVVFAGRPCAYIAAGLAECWRQNDSYVGASPGEIDICGSTRNWDPRSTVMLP